jgi:hypothetical protein
LDTIVPLNAWRLDEIVINPVAHALGWWGLSVHDPLPLPFLIFVPPPGLEYVRQVLLPEGADSRQARSKKSE